MEQWTERDMSRRAEAVGSAKENDAFNLGRLTGR